MKTLTIQEFVDDSENIIRRVEKGEKIAVTDGEVSAVLVPSNEYVYSMNNNDGP
jgi:antitoxin (DNA-binding transcriptional repressor) of toxin-antitoxin stability system